MDADEALERWIASPFERGDAPNGRDAQPHMTAARIALDKAIKLATYKAALKNDTQTAF
jgi:hypothetical protein